MKHIKVYLPGFILFVCSVILTLFIYKDYGLSWDEETQREIGEVTYKYVFKGDPKLNTYLERDHGSGFEMPLVMLEKALGLTDFREIFLLRHLVQNMFFLLCMFCGYVLALHLFKSQWLACLGFLILVYSPRLFAHSFFNSKDIPFMGMFLVSFAISRWAFAKDKSWAYCLLGIVVGYTTSIRLLSLILFAFLFAFLLIDVFQTIKTKEALKSKIVSVLLFLGGYCLALYICWPTLWERPIYSFIEAYNSMSHFRWDGDSLLNGKIIEAEAIPWYYIPIWFCITTPVLWLLFGVMGIVLFIGAFIKTPLQYLLNTPERNFLLYFLCFFTPVLMVIVLHSVVYDDWRHVYFIYPCFVLLLLYGVDRLVIKTKIGVAVTLLCVVQFALIWQFIVKYHPYQQVYFNELVSHKKDELQKKYELDYWGLSNKEALEFILAYDSAADIKVNDPPTTSLNVKFLPEEDRKRLRTIVGDEAPDYYIALFRTYPNIRPEEKLVHEIRVKNSSIIRVYKYKQ